MRTLIVLAFLGCVCASPFVQYTPAVAAERARFAQLYKLQAAAAAAAPDDYRTGASYHQAPAYQHTPSHHYNAISHTTKWTGPVAATVPAGVGGQVTPVGDTPEVTAARNAFFNTYNAAVTGVRPASHHQGSWTPHHPTQARWTGPKSHTVPAGVHGSGHQFHQDADVASATAAFLQAYNAAVAANTGRRY